MSVKVTIDKRELEAFQKRIGGDADKAIRTLAFRVVGEAKTRTPVDTGALRNSITVEDKSRGRYWVKDGMEYGIYQELGFTHPGSGRFIQNAFMIPAVEQVRRYVAQVFKDEIGR